MQSLAPAEQYALLWLQHKVLRCGIINLQAIRMTELHIFYFFGTKKLELLECVWWALDMHVILKLARLRQRNYHKFKVRLGYIVSSELVYMTE